MRFLLLILAHSFLLACAEEAASIRLDAGSAMSAADAGGAPDAGGSPDAARDGGKADPKACIEGAAEEHQPGATAMHVAPGLESQVVYADVPPTGGTHSACWADFGVYEDELEDARWVHNLEHGGIVLLYRCDDGCAAQVAQLEDFVAAHPRTILTPYAALPTRFAAVAWEYRLLNNCVDLPAIQQFYEDHFNRGREDIATGPPDSCK